EVAFVTAKTLLPSFRFIRSTEPVVMTDVTIPAAVRMTTSDTTLSETIFSIVPGKRFRMLVLIVSVTPVPGCLPWLVATPLVTNPSYLLRSETVGVPKSLNRCLPASSAVQLPELYLLHRDWF